MRGRDCAACAATHGQRSEPSSLLLLATVLCGSRTPSPRTRSSPLRGPARHASAWGANRRACVIATRAGMGRDGAAPPRRSRARAHEGRDPRRGWPRKRRFEVARPLGATADSPFPMKPGARPPTSAALPAFDLAGRRRASGGASSGRAGNAAERSGARRRGPRGCALTCAARGCRRWPAPAFPPTPFWGPGSHKSYMTIGQSGLLPGCRRSAWKSNSHRRGFGLSVQLESDCQWFVIR